jgi:hypothetical protein
VRTCGAAGSPSASPGDIDRAARDSPRSQQRPHAPQRHPPNGAALSSSNTQERSVLMEQISIGASDQNPCKHRRDRRYAVCHTANDARRMGHQHKQKIPNRYAVSHNANDARRMGHPTPTKPNLTTSTPTKKLQHPQKTKAPQPAGLLNLRTLRHRPGCIPSHRGR